MKRLIAIFVALLLLMPSVAEAQVKRALLIGVGAHLDPAFDKTNADKDVKYLSEVLSSANYKQVIKLVNEQATKANIVEAFQLLEQSCGPKDIVYIHFSGHGQRIKDKSGDEPNMVDESWIPYDAYRKACAKDRGEKHLIDDELNILLTNIRRKVGDEGKILVVADCCFSGHSTRGDIVVRGVQDVFWPGKQFIKIPMLKDAEQHAANEQWITLSACLSCQVNYEHPTKSVGMLSYAIYEIVMNGNVGSNENFFAQIVRYIEQHRGDYPQHPTMTGLTDRYSISDILK
jgi:hypothetical protein